MRKSWDGFANSGGAVRLTFPHPSDDLVRVIPWPKGCPFTQHQVPQVNEKDHTGRVVLGVPYRPFEFDDNWWISTSVGSLLLKSVATPSYPAESDTIILFGRKYDKLDVVDRLSTLRPIEDK